MAEIELSKEAQLLIEIQAIRDMVEGGLTRRNIKEYRTTYVINMQDSLDATYPMLVPFNILSEMTNMVSVKVSFWILPFRAYSVAGAAQGSASGGGSTSGSQGSASGGGSTSGSGGGQTSSAASSGVSKYVIGAFVAVSNVGDENENGMLPTALSELSLVLETHTHTVSNHTHTTPNHTHPNHTHTTPAHTHPNHTHTAVYGIFEEDNSPSIKFSISKDNGITYGDIVGTYSENKLDIDIGSLVETVGQKLIKFESTARARLAVQIEIKLDVRR